MQNVTNGQKKVMCCASAYAKTVDLCLVLWSFSVVSPMTLDILYILLTIQYLFWSVMFFFVKRDNKKANRFIGILLICHAALFFYFYQSFTGNYAYSSIWLQLYWIPPLLQGPMLYLYLLQYSKHSSLGFKRVLIHSAPSIVTSLFFMGYYWLLDDEGRHFFTKIHMSGESYKYIQGYIFIHILLFVQMVTYLFLSAKVIVVYQRNAFKVTANVPTRRIAWMKLVVWFFTILSVGGFVVFDFVNVLSVLVVYLVMHFVLFHYIMYKAMTQVSVKESSSADTFNKILGCENPSSAINLHKVIEDMEYWIVNKGNYADNTLDVLKVAQLVGVPVCDVLNAVAMSGKNDFYTFVNELRLKQMLEQEAGCTVLKTDITLLASEFGFSSEKEMLNLFKNYKGTALADYRADMIKP